MKKLFSIILVILLVVPMISTSVFAYYGDYLQKAICFECGNEASLYARRAPTCTEEGLADYSCHRGVTIPALGHNFREYYITEPTCTESGVKVMKCSRCYIIDDSEPIIVPPTGHHWKVHWHGSPNCYSNVPLINYCCEDCGTYLDKISPKLDHMPEVDVAVAPTCTETGLTEGSHCGLCNMVLTKQEVIPATHIKSDYWLITKEPTDTESGERVKYCLSCDEILETETFDTVCEHTEVIDNAVEPTCTEFGLTEGSHCSKCNSVIVKQKAITKLPHTEVSFEEKESTCTEFGFKGGTYCSVCSTTITPQEVIHPTWHNKVRVEGVDPTCTEKGSTFWYYCSDCNEVLLEPIELPALGHGKTYTKKEPTCQETGWESVAYCQVCNEVLEKQGEIPITDCKEVIDEAVPATCTQTGLTEGSHCEYCSKVIVEQEVIPATGHSFTKKVTKQATCTEDGERLVSCHCGESRTEIIPKISHTESEKWIILKEPTETETGTKAKYCTVCSTVLESEIIPAEGCNHTVVEDAGYPATCTNNGLTSGSHCSECGVTISVQTIIPATGHTSASSNIIKEATCMETGMATHLCSVCNSTYVEIISAKGHTIVIDNAVEPTCDEVGLKEGKHCSVCDKVLVSQEVIPATGHNYTSKVTKEATCSKEGIITYTCDCGDTYTDVIPTIAHTEVIDKGKDPTCTSKGLTEGKRCSVCNKVLVAPNLIEALGHTEVTDEGKEPTCTETGLTEGKHCSVCNEVLIAQETIKALGHTEVIDEGKDVTCTDTGLTEGKHCSVCNEVLVAQETVDALGHTEVIDYGKDATCTETGLIDGKHCSVCDKVLISQEVIDALGHTEVIDYGKDATCTETGLTEGKHCSVCDKVLISQEVIDALGHSHTEEITKAPTCIDDGLKTFTCHCGDTYTEIIAKTGHIEGEWETIMSNTCVANGIRIKKCTDCGVILKIDTIAPKDHTKVTTSKSATYFENGYKNKVTCKECKTVISKGTTVKKLKLKTPTVKYTGGKKKLTVKYKKVKDATGFEVKYKVGKKTVIKTYNTKKSANKVIKSLKKGTYKVQIRAFVKSGKKTAYSAWTKAKKVKVK